MNLLRRKSFALCWNYANVSKRHFTGIRKDILAKIQLIPSPQKYYNELMKEVGADSKGLFHLDSSHLMLMAEKCKTPEDITAAVEAYYNFVGHRTHFSSSTVDKLVRRAIECKNPKAAFDIIYNHNFLLYYPHPTVLDDIMIYYRENKLIEEAKEFFPKVLERKLIKFNSAFFEQAILLSNETGDHTLAFNAFRNSRKAGLRISNEAFQAVANSLSQVSAQGENKKKILVGGSIIKNLGSYELNPEDFLQLSLSQISNPENAIRVFETLSEASVNLKEGSALLQNTESNQEYFRRIYNLVRGQRELYGRFSRALKNIQQKYSTRAIDRELYTLIQDLDKKANQADSSSSSEAPKVEKTVEENQS